MEDITHGERILEYVVECLVEGGSWQPLCSGECVGHKRIQPFDTVMTTGIRLRATRTKATPHVRRLAVHFVT
jgi:alpha-L-fucosidase